MLEKRKNLIVKTLVCLVYLLVVFILQAMVFSRVKIWGVKPLILPLAVVGAAIFNDRVIGGIVGICAGMLCDISFNEATIVFTLTLTFVGLTAGYLAETVLVKSFFSYIVVSFLTLILCAFVQVFGFLFIYNTPLTVLLDTILRQTAVSLLFAVPLYCVFGAVARDM